MLSSRTAPRGIAVSPTTGNVYVANDPNALSIISPSNQVISTIPVGLTPSRIAVSPTTGNVYVVNGGSNTVSVISPTAPVQFLPPQTTIDSPSNMLELHKVLIL